LAVATIQEKSHFSQNKILRLLCQKCIGCSQIRRCGDFDVFGAAHDNAYFSAAGGENAMRYAWKADISKLPVGLHTVDVLVSIYLGEGTATLVMYSFTLEITES
jgi:hypothetical protein